MRILNSKDVKYGFIEQSAFGAVVDDDGTTGSPVAFFTEMDCDHISLDPDTKVREGSGATGTRNKIYQDVVLDTKNSMPNFSNALSAKPTEIDYFLYAHFQNVVEGVGTPYDKTFTFLAEQPDFSADAGWFATFVLVNPVASTSWKVKDCISKALTFTCEPGDEGRLKISQEWVSRGIPSFVSNPNGATFTRNANTYYHFADIARATINFGAGAQAVTLTGAFEIALKHDVVPVGSGSGSFANYAIVNRDLTFKLIILKDAQTQTALTNNTTDVPVTVNIGWGNATPGTVDGDLDFTFTGKIDKVADVKEDVFGTELTGRILASTASTEPITVTMANAIDRAW